MLFLNGIYYLELLPIGILINNSECQIVRNVFGAFYMLIMFPYKMYIKDVYNCI